MRPKSYKNQFGIKPSFNSEKPFPEEQNEAVKKINEKHLLEDKTT
jgi:hypothetical protein